MTPIALNVMSKAGLQAEYRVPRLSVFFKEMLQILGSEGNNAVIRDINKRPFRTLLVGESLEQVTFLMNYPEMPTSPYGSVQSLAATGTTQGGAAAITNFIVIVTSASDSDNGVALPKANEDKVDFTYIVCNRSTHSITVYPSSGDVINNLGVDIGISVPAGGITSFFVGTPLDS
jgi:hypothetical protein